MSLDLDEKTLKSDRADMQDEVGEASQGPVVRRLRRRRRTSREMTETYTAAARELLK